VEGTAVPPARYFNANGDKPGHDERQRAGLPDLSPAFAYPDTYRETPAMAERVRPGPFSIFRIPLNFSLMPTTAGRQYSCRSQCEWNGHSHSVNRKV